MDPNPYSDLPHRYGSWLSWAMLAAPRAGSDWAVDPEGDLGRWVALFLRVRAS